MERTEQQRHIRRLQFAVKLNHEIQIAVEYLVEVAARQDALYHIAVRMLSFVMSSDVCGSIGVTLAT